MKILITGGAGYIGSTLVPMLLDLGHEVTVYDLFLWGVSSLFPAVGNTKLRIVKGDIRDRDHISHELADKNAVIHLAAIVGYPACDNKPECAVETNISGTRNITECKRRDQILVYASTGSCYGATENVCTESTKLMPLTLYGRTKAEGENLVRSVGGISLRLATLFGLSPRLRLDLLINNLLFNALTRKELDIYEGGFRRTFLHVRDAALAFTFALNNALIMEGSAYNVGDEKLNMTKLQVARCITTVVEDCILKESSSGHDNDRRNYEVSYEKIHELGYCYRTSIEDGIKEMLKVLPCISVEESVTYCNI